ncbi:sodium-dependent bicarbonate transport family permease [Planctomyces sp. SH-PL62]|uniref:sodium-dependent bicarbonate transport family permease n=1 Tax=Planctomyces sp. SH-PL62 TaxID=1636152 RepID=UPI000837E3F5
MLHEFWYNFRHNLFKPLLLFFYLGFLVPILRVQFEFPYVMYQALTIYLLIAIGWHGGEELAHLNPDSIKSIVGFMGVGFLANTLIGLIAFGILRSVTRMRRVDQATVAGYYGSDSAGTFVTALGVLGSAHIAFDAYMPVMLAIMEIPGCLVALYLVSHYRAQGMDALGNMPYEPGYDPSAEAPPILIDEHGRDQHASAVQTEAEMSLERMEHESEDVGNGRKKGFINGKLLHEVFLNTGLYLLFGGIIIGLISGLQGPEVTRADDSFFVTLFQGVLCLFLLEMGMTASRKLKDLKTAGWNFVAFGLLAPNLFATLGIMIAHTYAWVTGTHFELGTYVLFSVLCGSASYIAVPAVQRLAIPEASPTLPLAASLGLTFSYNVTIGIPIYMEIAKAITRSFPIG